MLQGLVIEMTVVWLGACACYAWRVTAVRRGPLWPECWAVLDFWFRLSGPATLTQFVLLFAIGIICLNWKRRSIGRFALLSIAGSVLAIALTDLYAQTVWASVAREFPLTSVADRLAYEAEHPQPLAADDATSSVRRAAVLPSSEGLKNLDEIYDASYRYQLRNRSLAIAHASQVEKFANVTESFGARRMPSPAPLYARRTAGPPVRQPDVKLVCRDDEPAATLPFSAPGNPWTEPYHSQALVNFANLEGWGYVRDREQVAGFESHGFDKYFDPSDKAWLMLRVELVSLLKHDVPGVYISEFLPAMDELREAPVRPLDAFEERSLAVLFEGEDIETEVVGQQVRMLGAIRAADKCLDCHTVEHGALMGAFSYVLLPTAMVERQAQR